MQMICVLVKNKYNDAHMRLTKHRREILEILEKSDETMSAADINASLPHINLVTIYRTLEYFVEEKAIKKLHLGEQEAQYEVQHEPHHHAICSVCGKVIHFVVDDSALLKEFSLPDFSITHLEVTLHGSCAEHSPKSAKAK
jgi:Fur family transcriptional regulator, peroxide stress response regulator